MHATSIRRTASGLIFGLLSLLFTTAAQADSQLTLPVHPAAVLAKTESADSLVSPGRTWIVKASDNLCGLSEANQLSSPAKVNYKRLLSATPEMQKAQREGIKPNSPEGVQLRAEAADRIARAAESVRQSDGHCSVWKAIRHKDGRSIVDVTSRVLAQL